MFTFYLLCLPFYQLVDVAKWTSEEKMKKEAGSKRWKKGNGNETLDLAQASMNRGAVHVYEVKICAEVVIKRKKMVKEEGLQISYKRKWKY